MSNIWQKYKVVITIFICVMIFISVVKSCEKEPKIVTRTVTKIVTKHDTIIKVKIQEVPKTVYIQKIKTVEGETKIVYVDKPTDSTIKANQYDATVVSNNATAQLKITTTGELLDVQGVITYPEKETTTTITKTKAKSGLFIYGSVPLNKNQINVETGLIYQYKNTLGVMGGVQYNEFTKLAELKI